MQKIKHYCDYCKNEITPKNKPRKIKTTWIYILSIFYYGFGNQNDYVEIGGDGCNDCYHSFKHWAKSRNSQHTQK